MTTTTGRSATQMWAARDDDLITFSRYEGVSAWVEYTRAQILEKVLPAFPEADELSNAELARVFTNLANMGDDQTDPFYTATKAAASEVIYQALDADRQRDMYRADGWEADTIQARS